METVKELELALVEELAKEIREILDEAKEYGLKEELMTKIL